MAWQHVSPEVTVEGFKRCCMSSALGETCHNMVWYGNEEDGNVWLECEEDGRTDCKD